MAKPERCNVCGYICMIVTVLAFTLLGFMAGLMVGSLSVESDLFKTFFDIASSKEADNQDNLPDCVIETPEDTSNKASNQNDCGLCIGARLLSVSGGDYADCNGFYTLTNLTSIWDSKHNVYQRISGGVNIKDKRFIYWNSHFYGENFYGWSIGDARSLVESGPFHSQGRGGVSNQPWQGSWTSNITVTIKKCSDILQEGNQ